MKFKSLINALLSVLLVCHPLAVVAQPVEWTLSQAYLESIARFASEYAGAARNKDYGRVLRLSCLQLDIAIQYLDPDTVETEGRKSEVAALRDNSVKLREELKTQGYCD